MMPSGDDVSLPVGFLATTVDGYADAMWAALSMTEDERVTMATLARARASVFGEGAFNGAFHRRDGAGAGEPCGGQARRDLGGGGGTNAGAARRGVAGGRPAAAARVGRPSSHEF